MPQWIEDRKDRLLRKNPGMDESKAWAIATQQAHALGKTPKGYGTAEGRRTAKKKYTTPKDDQKTAGVPPLPPKQLAALLEGLAQAKEACAFPPGVYDLYKQAGFLDVLTRPIPGTPELFPKVNDALHKITRYTGQAGAKAEGGAAKSFAMKTPDEIRAGRRASFRPEKMKAAFQTSAYSTPLNPHIASGASVLPPFRSPQLQKALQKFATEYYNTQVPPKGSTKRDEDKKKQPDNRAAQLDRDLKKKTAPGLC